ncbi:MAG: ABC transporter ATP-binding protein [Bryobacterales bacterium]|nr:ABC transporter ATP-binding protein [Bryobacterales bacterium]
MIHIGNMTRRFASLTAVDRLNLDVARGEIFGLVGPDGAGKTTTLRVLCGLLDPTEGAVSIGNLDVGKNLDAVKDQIGYMAQKFGLYGDLTVEENMIFYSDLFGVTGQGRAELMTRLLDMTRMSPFRTRPAAKLSGGMKQKLALMCTLLHRPQVLLLDEPTNGVDPLSRRDFWDILYQLAKDGMTILVSTAYLDEAERCHRVGLMHKGRLVRCDVPDALKAVIESMSFAAEAEDLRQARHTLRQVPGVLDAEPAGAQLHVYLESGVKKEDIESRTPGIRLWPIRPSLEDVFIALIRAEERHAGN